MQLKRIITYGFLVIVYAASASAYIDPGTGSAIAGSVWPMIVAFFSAVGAFIVKHFWKPIKNLFRKNKASNEK